MEKLNVKQGDKVIVSSRWNYDAVKEVEKITPKGFIKVNGTLYNEFGNERTSNSWGSNKIRVADEESIKLIEENNFIRLVLEKMENCKKLSYDQAERINKILNQ